MKIGAILHNVNCSGGVRRFLEIGNEFIDRGIQYTVFCGFPQPCKWFNFKGRITGWTDIKVDYILIGDPRCFGVLPEVKGKIFIYVIAGQEHYLKMYGEVYGKYPFILNNRIFGEHFPDSYLVEGGVNTKKFTPKKRTVLFYDTDKEWNRWKHSAEIKKALTGIDSIKLIGLSGLTNEEMAKAYHQGNYFVSWETDPGWSNTSAEALASGLTVVSFGGNCEPFSDRIIKVKNLQELREFFIDPMKEFSWERVVDKLLEIFKNAR